MGKWLKRLTITTGAILLFLVAIAACGWIYLNSEHARGWLQRQINSRIPGSLTWERHKLSLFKGAIESQNFQIQGPDQMKIAGFDRLMVNVK